MPTPAGQAAAASGLRPFRAVRYDPGHVGDLGTVLAPPYDDFGSAHAHALRYRPHHVARLLYAQDPQAAARQWNRWRHRGVLRRDERPSLYVYQQQRGARILQRGLIGELPLADPPAGASVLPHEAVVPHVVGQRTRLMSALGAQLEPLLLTYRATESTAAHLLDRITRRPPLSTAGLGDITHSLWACTDETEIGLITGNLAGDRLLIADGHHRHAACRKLSGEAGPGTWDSALSLLIDSASYPLQLTAIHRVVPGLEADKAAAAASDVARVRPLTGGPRQPGPDELVLVGAGRAWSITDPAPDALRHALDGLPRQWVSVPAAVADHLLLAQAWSVTDLPGAVHHVHGLAQATGAVAAPGSGTTLLLPPIDEGTVRKLAEEGVLLPRKSTSFGPKPVAGLVMRATDTR